MRLEDCVTAINVAIAAPLVRSGAEENWIRARASGSIPDSLYELYEKADYLSFGAGPRFLMDGQNILFTYFTMLLRCLLEGLTDADDQLRGFVIAQKMVHDPGKIRRGEEWHPDADVKAKRHFRDLLIALHGGLDTYSDLVALFFTGTIPDLTLGRGEFRRIESWLSQPPPVQRPVATPYDSHIQNLYDALCPLVHPAPPEKDWLPFARMLRNKAAHLGHPVFRQVGLHDKEAHFFVFLPRKWPYFWERDITVHDPIHAAVVTDLRGRFHDTLIHQDVISFASALRLRVFKVIDQGVSVVSSAYSDFCGFQPNERALAELNRNSVAYEFQSFAR